MLSPVEKLDSRTFYFLRIWPVFLFFAVAFGNSLYAVARTPVKHSHQEIGINERRQAEQRLWQLGYWAGPIDGRFDSASRQALVAFQKVEGRARTGILTSTELNALLAASRPRPRFEGYGHIEIDLTRQVLFVIDETGTVSRILPVSSGNEGRYVDHCQVHRAHTPRGTFKVLRKINGWRLSSLGLLYYPSYIVNGIAVHGSLSVPTYAASHGCIRVPMFAAKELSGLMPVGIEVSVYGS
jgi:cell wall hydrolase